ncbi:MAG: 3,4-dehydroadipyl-CoA semialdehyde dehydrogenase [Planctomycetota bacterium]|jgi:oxepin-CoA hydrolase/3-oxo-5,6-dehydrosuberyl-CoA semialdehyde dehydrogenase
MKTLSSYVCGSWQKGSAQTQTLFNPATEEELALCPSGGFDAAAIANHARELGQPALRALSLVDRAKLLKQLSAAIHEAREELIDISVQNGGNTRGDAKFDLDGATGTLSYYASLGKKLGDRDFLADGEGIQLGRTPRFWGQHIWSPRRGLAVHINAFNFPAWGMAEKLACAILAGIPVVTKPGTASSILAWRIAEIVVERDILPEGTFQFLCGSAREILKVLGPQDAVGFTGSSVTGAAIRGQAEIQGNHVRLNVEADSLNAAVLAPDVEDDADAYGLMIRNLVIDLTQKAGQKCTAVRRILVPEDLVDDFTEFLVSELAAIKIGDPADKSNRMGPVASAAQFEDVRTGIDALAKLGEVVCGGSKPLADRGYFLAPTLIKAADVRAEAIHRDEVFGPVASILPYSGSAAEAAELVNLGGGGLVSSLYSNDRRWTEDAVLGMASTQGRIWIGSDKAAGEILPPGAVLPQTVHGGPGRAGAGEELGGLRGLEFYMQRTALQGFQGLLARSFGSLDSADKS